MRILEIEQNSPEWLDARKSKITGSKLSDIVVMRGNTQKVGFYQLIADGLGLDDGSEDGRDRGHATEDEALDAFALKYNKKVDHAPGMWLSDDDDNIAISPDGGIKDEAGDYVEAVEAKCPGSARYIEFVITNKLSTDYRLQGIQYFIVNEKLKTLYFVFYDPRITNHPMHVLEMHRADYEAEIKQYHDYQVKTLALVDEWVEKLGF